MKTATIIGHFGEGLDLANGQTIKTRIITDELIRRYGSSEIQTIDTHGGIKALIKAPYHIIKAVCTSKNVIILPAQNGLRVYVPLLDLICRFFHNAQLHYIVVGGWLPLFLKKEHWLILKLKRFSGIYVETALMKNAMEEQGFRNIHILPNCKQLHVLSTSELVYSETEPFRICTFSRVMREKGIEDAIAATQAANDLMKRTVCTLDIYGQIDKSQATWFEDLRSRFPDCVKYKGVVPFNQSVDVLKDYFALLFPTYYEGEGFAGTLIDAMAAGIPVIASKWKFNPEIIQEGKNGMLFNAQDVDELTQRIVQIASDPGAWNLLKPFCIEMARQYQPDRVIEELITRLA